MMIRQKTVSALGALTIAMACSFSAAAEVEVYESSVEAIEVGATITRWRVGAAGGEIGGPFDWLDVRREWLPRGPVTLLGSDANGETRQWTLSAGDGWAKGDPAGFEAYRTLLAAGQPEALTAAIVAEGDPARASWLAFRAAEALDGLGDAAAAHAFFDQAADRGEAGGLTRAQYHIANSNASSRWRAGQYDNVEASLAQAAALADADSLSWVYASQWLGVLYTQRSRFDDARALFGQVMPVVERLAPGSELQADIYHSMGNGEFWSDQHEQALEYHERALTIRLAIDPNSLAVARSYGTMMNIPWRRGQLDEAEALGRKALAVYEAMEDDYLQASMLTNLANVAHDRARYDESIRLRQEALKLAQASQPDSLLVADNYLGLGNASKRINDYRAALRYLEAARQLYQKLAPEGRQMAFVLSSVGEVYAREDDHVSAREAFQSGVDILRKLAPGGLMASSSMFNLSSYLLEQDEVSDAQPVLEEACGIIQDKAPNSWREAMCAGKLGELYRRLGLYDQAGQQLERSRHLYAQRAPGSARLATAYRNAALLARDLGREGEAVTFFRQAMDALDDQAALVGGGGTGSEKIQAGFESLHKDHIQQLLDLGRTREAYQVLGRYHGNSISQLFSGELYAAAGAVPEALLTERRALAEDYVRRHKALWQLPAEQLPARLAELERVRQERQRVNREVRDYQRPPANRERQREAADHVLAFAQLKDGMWLFHERGEALTARRLVLSPEELAQRVDRFRLLIQQRADLQTLAPVARTLYQELVGPELEQARGTVVLVPDAALHLLPFAALMDKNDDYLVEQLNLLLARNTRPHLPQALPREARLVALGDPPADSLRLASTRGGKLGALPFAREEAQSITALFPDSEMLLGGAATETQVRSAAANAGVLHFATHAVFDNAEPLNSYLKLAEGGGEHDGNLYAWEVFEELNLTARLVTLSACEAALGEYVAGSGLLGLTRAFQQSGAESVVAALWRVADESTPLLMAGFYEQLAAQAEPDAALRVAQAQISQSEQFGHPFYWAAFQLYVD
ncbi:MAG: CHAT domain-containing tetratricopeptide repeat protein [Pseudomonadota bacterium]